MKKQLLFSVIISLLFCAGLYAQTDAASKPVKTGDEWKMPNDAVKRSQLFSDKLKKELGLDDERTKKIFQTYLSNTKAVDEIAVLPLTDKEKSDRLKANHITFNEKLKVILTDAQYNKYLQLSVSKS